MAEYVKNKDFYKAIVEYKTTKSRKSYELVGKMILSIVTRYIKSPRFAKYTLNWTSDMISDATYMCLMKIDNFDEITYDNPFAYFTQTIKNSFKATTTKEKNLSNTVRSVTCVENLE